MLKLVIIDLHLKNYYKILKIRNVIPFVVLKLDRLTRSVYDWENILKFLEENDAYLDCANNDMYDDKVLDDDDIEDLDLSKEKDDFER